MTPVKSTNKRQEEFKDDSLITSVCKGKLTHTLNNLIMEKVYIVYYDNGQSWEDHYVSVSKVFASLETATKYAEEKNAPLQKFTPSVSKERYESENWAEETGCGYEQFLENEQYEWLMSSDAKYYVSEEELHP